MAKVGRPSSYRPDYAIQAAKLCALGATDIELADFFKVNVATINRWKAQFAEFCASIKTAKCEADDRVERSLYARAVGYEHPETDIRVIEGQIVMTEMRKHYPPDSVAAMFWLKNRRNKEWRDIKAIELSGPEGGPQQHNHTIGFVKPKE